MVQRRQARLDRGEAAILGRSIDQCGSRSATGVLTQSRGGEVSWIQGRTSIRDDYELLEKIYVGLYEESGEVHFVDVAHHLKPLEMPAGTKVLMFEQIKDDLVRLFRQRNPKLRVKGMPKVDDSGAVTAASPALDEAFSDD
jgi:hypothetical protein